MLLLCLRLRPSSAICKQIDHTEDFGGKRGRVPSRTGIPPTYASYIGDSEDWLALAFGDFARNAGPHSRMVKIHHKKRKVLSRTRSNYLDDSASIEHGCGLGGRTIRGLCYLAIRFDIHIRTLWYSIVNIGKRLHSKSPCLFDELSPAILAIGAGPVRCTAPFNTRGIVRFAQRLRSRILWSASAHFVHREIIRLWRSASRCVVIAAATQVVTPDKAGFDTIKKWFEIEETSGRYAQALDDLGADGGRPSVQGRICRVWDRVPIDELAYTSCDDSAAI